MTHVVTESCIRCKYTECVKVCPTDAFREGPNMLVIEPDDCIDCALCVPVCPPRAIFLEADLPSEQEAFTAINLRLARQWPEISRGKAPLPDADDWLPVKHKREWLDEGG